MSPPLGISLILLFIALAEASRRIRWLEGLGFTFVVLAFGAAAFTFPAWFIAPGGFEMKQVIAPLVIGFAIRRFLPRLADKFVRVLPPLAMLSIALIVAITVAMSRDDLLKVGLVLLAASACHNATGYALGYGAARLLGLDGRDSRTVALEVGLQNGGMATGLAFNVLQSPAAALGAAVFGPWSAITSSALASWWRREPKQASSS